MVRFQALKGIIGKPRAASVAGLVALVVSCCYVYLLSAHAWRDVLVPATPCPAAQATSTAFQTATRTATPATPTGSPTATPTYTPISYTPTPTYISYTVQPGDTLSGIARRFNTTVRAIMEFNSLTDDLISIGQEVLIPGGPPASMSLSATTATEAPEVSTATPTPTATLSPTPTPTSSAPTAEAELTVARAGAAASGEPLLVAFYYAWYGFDQWTADKVPDIPAVPYESRDRNTMVRHVQEAQDAGVDGFAVAWYGPQTHNNQTETNLRTMLDVASQRGFRITVYFETRSPFFDSQADLVEALRYVLSRHADHPAFLRYAGKPLIFFWAVGDVFRAQGQSAVDAWAAIRQQVDPGGNSLWIADGADVDFLRVFDGHNLYNITWNPPVDVDITLSRWGNRVREYNSQHGAQKLWVATVMPGYDDLRIEGRSNRFALQRSNGAYYRETWQAALNSAPDLIAITSFNEWCEGTQIEPSVTYGQLYLELTSEFSRAFKAARR